jgi:hypothetical protein
MADHMSPQNTFVVRFWWEAGSVAAQRLSRWRGRIEHLQSGDALSFLEARQLLGFIERFVNLESQDALPSKNSGE